MTLRISLLAIFSLAMAFGLSYMAQGAYMAQGNLMVQGATSVSLSSCHVKDISRPVKCAEFKVLLDRDGGGQERITVSAVIVPAMMSRTSRPPLMVLAGGPGQAASEYGAIVTSLFKEANKTRDIILFDQRGTGRSEPLQCGGEFLPLEAIDTAKTVQFFEQCHRDIEVDVRHFTTYDIIRDMEEFRQLMGYGKISLWGGSYGTKLAQHYLQYFGAHVEMMILDSNLSTSTRLFQTSPLTAQRSLDLLFKRCREDKNCHRSYPGLEKNFYQLLAEVGEGREITYVNPQDGRATSVITNRDVIAEAVRGTLYVPQRATLLPFAISAAVEGNFTPLVSLSADTASWAGDTMYMGSTLSILCAEEIAQMGEDGSPQLGIDSQTAFIRDSYYQFWRVACESWPSKALPEGYFDLTRSPVRTLILSGFNDPVTPPSLGDVVASGLINSLHVISPMGSHITSPHSCIPEVITDFLDGQALEDLDISCVDRMSGLPFALSTNGPLNAGIKQ